MDLSHLGIKMHVIAAICLTYIFFITVGIVIPMTVYVIFQFGVPKGLFSFLTYCHFLHSNIVGGVEIILQAYIISLK